MKARRANLRSPVARGARHRLQGLRRTRKVVSPLHSAAAVQRWSSRQYSFRSYSGSLERGRFGFTLIELLVVIAIIGVLAALLLPAGAAIKRRATVKRAETELAQVETAIERYKTDKGFYPPENSANTGSPDLYEVTNSPAMFNSLFYELGGVKTNGVDVTTYYALDDSGSISKGDLSTVFGVGGVMNLASGGDEGTVAKSFIKEFKPSQYLTLRQSQMETGLPNNRYATTLGTQLRGPVTWKNDSGHEINPWRYVSSSPNGKHNLETVDLWVDVFVGNKTNRISNWSEKPENVFE